MSNETDTQQSNDRAYREKWWRAVLASNLTPGQKLVATGLGWHMNFNPEHKWYRSAWKSAGELAKEIGLKETTTTDALNALRKKGWLHSIGRTTGGRGAHIYKFTIPASESVPQLSQEESEVSSTTESVPQLSQSQSHNWVRPSSTTESESVPQLRDSLNNSLTNSLNDTHDVCVDSFDEEDARTETDMGVGVDVKACMEKFRDEYPKRITLGLLEGPYREQLKQGATPDELLRAAQAYAKECTDTNLEVRYRKLASNFLSGELWRDYANMAPTHDGNDIGGMFDDHEILL